MGSDKDEESNTVRAAAALKQLSPVSEGKAVSAKLRELLPEIEEAIARGVTHQQIIQSLQQNGIKVTLNTFRSVLYRSRGRGKKQKQKKLNKPPESDHPTDPKHKASPSKKFEIPKAKTTTFNWDPLALLPFD